jgi:hypothetical protein
MVSDKSCDSYWWVSPDGRDEASRNIFQPFDITKTAPTISKWIEQEEMKKLVGYQKPEVTFSRDTQVGGDHYRQVPNMQPWDIIDAYGLDYYAGNVLKYLLRHKKKNGKEDLEKARHYLTKMIDSYADAS